MSLFGVWAFEEILGLLKSAGLVEMMLGLVKGAGLVKGRIG